MVQLVASTILAASVVIVPTQSAGTQEIEKPVIVVATSSPIVEIVVPKKATSTPVVKKIITKAPGNCVEYEDIISQYNWPDDVAMQVCKHESRGNPSAVGDGDTAHVSCGLMQIRTLKGRPSCTALKDPETNVAYAYKMWKKEGWSPWSVCINLVNCD